MPSPASLPPIRPSRHVDFASLPLLDANAQGARSRLICSRAPGTMGSGSEAGCGPDFARSRSVDDKFFPRGAIASFVVLAILYAGIWYAIYFVALERG
jgi:hypothetical protein